MKPPFTLERFLDLYPPTTPVKFDTLDLTLGQALDIQALGCPVPLDERDDIKNIIYLAGKLSASGSLRSEDKHLLELESPKTGQ